MQSDNVIRGKYIAYSEISLSIYLPRNNSSV